MLEAVASALEFVVLSPELGVSMLEPVALSLEFAVSNVEFTALMLVIAGFDCNVGVSPPQEQSRMSRAARSRTSRVFFMCVSFLSQNLSASGSMGKRPSNSVSAWWMRSRRALMLMK